jgi:hypothetical protein
VAHAPLFETEPAHSVERDVGRQWSILGNGKSVIGETIHNRLPALTHRSEIATPGLDLLFTSSGIGKSVEITGVTRGLHRGVVKDVIEYFSQISTGRAGSVMVMYERGGRLVFAG